MKWMLICKTQIKSYSIDDNSYEGGEMNSLLVTIDYRCI